MYIRIYFLSILFSMLLWGLIVFGEVGRHTNSSQWVADVYHYKEDINISSPKIVIVGGSNGLFGVNSSILSEALGYPVLNDCVNAGVELPTILAHAERVIKRGDIVIAPLEYPLYSYSGEAGEQMIDYLYAREADMVKDLTLFEQFWIFWHISYDRVYRGYFDGEDKKSLTGVYGVHNIDKNGDQINTEAEHQSEQMRAELNGKEPERYGEGFVENSLGFRYISKFVNWCRDRGVRVIFVPSTLMDSPYYHNSEIESRYYSNFKKMMKSKGFIYAGEPFDYMYDKSLYFNTNFHLNSRGRDLRTKRLIEDLNPLFPKNYKASLPYD